MSQETNRQTMLCMCSFCDLFLPQGKESNELLHMLGILSKVRITHDTQNSL